MDDDTLQRVTRELSGPRIILEVTVEELSVLIQRRQAQALGMMMRDFELHDRVQQELAKLTRLRLRHMEDNPAVEVMVKDEPEPLLHRVTVTEEKPAAPADDGDGFG